MITSLSGSNLLSSDLLRCRIVAHVGARCIVIDWLSSILLAGCLRRRVQSLSVGMGRANGVTVTIRYAAIGAMFLVHGPRTRMVAMVHALRWRLRLGFDTDAGRAGSLMIGR